MQPDRREQLDELLAKLHTTGLQRWSEAAGRALLQLFPGGSLVDILALGVQEQKELDDALTLILTSLKEIVDTRPTDDQLIRVEETINQCLATYERLFTVRLDMSDRRHDEILRTLHELSPARSPASAPLFVISGPSAAGKDSILHAVVMKLRARGLPCEILTKYTTRGPRENEFESAYFLPYQRHVTEAEFDALAARREIILPYPKYNHRYGLSRSALESNLQRVLPMFCILSDFPLVHRSIPELRRQGLRVIPILIIASAAACRRRMYGRNLPSNEVPIRIAEMESDCAYIETNAAELAYTYSLQIVNDDDHTFNDSANDVYKFVWDVLKMDAKLLAGPREHLLLGSRTAENTAQPWRIESEG